MDCSPPAFSVYGTSQARILEGVAIPSLRGSSQPRVGPLSPESLLHCRQILYRGATGEAPDLSDAISSYLYVHPTTMNLMNLLLLWVVISSFFILWFFFPSGCSELWCARITYPNPSGFTNFSYIFHVLSCFQAQRDFLFLAGLPIVIPSSLWPLIGKLWHLERTFLKTVGILVFGPDVKRILIAE